MARNIEVKAVLSDREKAEATARSLSPGPFTVLEQEDVFFTCGAGRLKLRMFPEGPGELIAYERPDGAGPRLSSYGIYEAAEPEALRGVLSRALGEWISVKKERRVFLVGQTRVHLDRVEGLGDFIELEVVLQPGQDAEEGRRIAEGLMEAFGIRPEDLVTCAYADLLVKDRKG